MQAIIRLSIAPGAEWGYLATVDTVPGGGGKDPDDRVRYNLPTKEDCHCLAAHIARRSGHVGYEVFDET